MDIKQIDLCGNVDQVRLSNGLTITELDRYGQWVEDAEGTCLVPGYLSGSDYSGSLVERSNYEAFQEQFANGDGVWWTDVAGGYRTYAIVIDCGLVPLEAEEDLASFLNGLQDYPLADEDLHSRLEMEATDESWDNWARYAFVRDLERQFEVELDDADPGLVYTVFRECCDKSNSYWVNESGGDMWIDLKRVVKAVTQTDIDQLLQSVEKEST